MGPLFDDQFFLTHGDSTELSVNDDVLVVCLELYKNTPVHVSSNPTDVFARQIVKRKIAQGDHTVFYVMNMGSVGDVIELWYKNLPQVQAFYQLRCNQDPILLSLLVNDGTIGLSCANRNEIEIALKYVNKDHILYKNPLWTRTNVRHAREKGISLVSVASEEDLSRFVQYYPEARLLLRVTMDQKLTDDGIMVDEVDVNTSFLLLYKAYELGVKLTGLSISLRTLVPTFKLYAYALAKCSELLMFGRALGHPMNVLDLGERIPNSINSFLTFSNSMIECIIKFLPSDKFEHLQIIAQPDTLFAASHYSLVTPIIGKRTVKAVMLTNDETDGNTAAFIYQISDGFYGSFGGHIETRMEPTCRPLNTFIDKLSTYASFIGPTLCQTDVIRSLIRIQQLQIGEWLIWDEMGAYSMVNSCSKIGELTAIPSIHYFIGRKQWAKIAPQPLGECSNSLVLLADNESNQCTSPNNASTVHNRASFENLSSVDSTKVNQFCYMMDQIICNDSSTLRGELM